MPIINNYKVEKKEALAFEPIPEDVYKVELLDIEEQTKPRYQKPDEIENTFSFQCVLLHGRDKKGESLRGRNMWFNFVPNYLYIGSKGRNKLYNAIESLLGRELSPQEEAEFETIKLNKLIGKQCRIVVKNTSKGEKTYSNIDRLLVIDEKAAPLTAEEKEKAKVKSKESQEQASYEDPNWKPQEAPMPTAEDDIMEIAVDQIPF